MALIYIFSSKVSAGFLFDCFFGGLLICPLLKKYGYTNVLEFLDAPTSTDSEAQKSASNLPENQSLVKK
jgi:hypothetical protein